MLVSGHEYVYVLRRERERERERERFDIRLCSFYMCVIMCVFFNTYFSWTVLASNKYTRKVKEIDPARNLNLHMGFDKRSLLRKC